MIPVIAGFLTQRKNGKGNDSMKTDEILAALKLAERFLIDESARNPDVDAVLSTVQAAIKSIEND